MVRLEWIFLMQCALGILMMVIILKITQMKKQMDTIKKEVSDYIFYVTQEELAVEQEEQDFAKKDEFMGENAQNQLIHAVLSEYFP